MRKKEHILLLIILSLSFLLRLYRFDGPVADWHSWRQADTSAVSRNFVKFGFDLLHPRFDDLSNVPSGIDNPMGYRFVEFPIYNALQASLFKTVGILTIEEWGRLVTIVLSTLSSLLLYLLVKKHAGVVPALFTSFFFSFLPYNIYYGRVILPDPSMVFASLTGIYFFDLWTEKKEKHKYYFLLLSAIFTAVAFLIKPYALFFVLPIVYLAWKTFGLKLFAKWQLWLFLLFTITPLVLWRWWMMQYPEGIPVSAWLFNGNGIRFRPSFFRWILFERITKLISGYFGIILLFLGLVSIRRYRNYLFFLSYLLSSVLYTVVIATGNVQHDYYQILVMPTVAIFYGLGAATLFNLKYSFLKIPVGKVAVVVLTIGTLFFSWNLVKDYFNINNRSIVVAGKAVDILIPKNAKIIAPYDGDTSFLYQTRRQGWASFEKDLPDMIKMGADYLVLVNPTVNDKGFAKKYQLVSETKQYILFDLKKPL